MGCGYRLWHGGTFQSGPADAFYNAAKAGRLRYFGIRHEGAAAFAASGYAKLTGRPAACFSIAGPGATNLLTGLWDAQVDRVPILALTGQVNTQVLGPGAFQDRSRHVLEVAVHDGHAAWLGTSWGAWYLTEIVGFVLVPCVMFTWAVRRRNLLGIRVASILTLVGILLNRLNISVIAFKWYEAVRYVPTWMEIVVTLMVVFAEIWVFRWVVNRMPVLSDPPAWAREPHSKTDDEEETPNLRLVKPA